MMDYQQYRKESSEYGVLAELKHPLAFVRGLPEVAVGEVVVFENGITGQVTALQAEFVEVLVLSSGRLVPGTEVVRTNTQLSVKVGQYLQGAAINPLGQSLFPDNPVVVSDDATDRVTDINPPHISHRTAIKTPFLTGTSVTDLLLPLGRGQRQAVLGDPTTGKNSFLLTTVKAHATHGKVVYAMIGKPWNDIRKVYNFIAESPNKDNITLVATSAEDIISLICQTPFTAMTIAEYWRDQGEDVVIIFDDLSTHARFYREVGLLARHFPARESYPGDIFHLHARLLERGGNFIHPDKGESSITCLPVGETVRGELTGYIVSNLIGITDGHLLFDETIFSQGRRPAIDVSLSVTRVGGHTQSPLIRALHRKLVVLMNKHEEAQGYTHFGAELPEAMQRILDAGDCLLEFLSQPLFFTVPYSVQVVFSAMIWMGWMNQHKTEIPAWRNNLSAAYNQDGNKQILDALLEPKSLDEFVQKLAASREHLLGLCQASKT